MGSGSKCALQRKFRAVFGIVRLREQFDVGDETEARHYRGHSHLIRECSMSDRTMLYLLSYKSRRL